MAGWDDIVKQVGETPSEVDYIRRKYLKTLIETTGRNLIAYYSGWLHMPPNAPFLDINDGDMEGFMNAVKGMDCSKGLDLILHTPGGDPNAAESIINYLKDKFDKDIRVIVPHMAMSAGTMMACASKEIVMGKQSSLGPIDPQFQGIPAHNIKLEFEEAKKDLEANPGSAQYWAIKLQQYPAAFMYSALDAIALSEELAKNWLLDCMFDDGTEKSKFKAAAIVAQLNDHQQNRSHGRHFNHEFCKHIGLTVKMLEDNNDFQDIVLSVHHAFMVSIERKGICKIIENGEGKAYIISAKLAQ